MGTGVTRAVPASPRRPGSRGARRGAAALHSHVSASCRARGQVLFPALRSVVPPHEYDALGEDFERLEHRLFGEAGFEKVVDEIAGFERRLHASVGALLLFCRCPRLGTRTASLGETLLVTETGPMFAARRGPGAFLLPANHTVLIVGGHGRRAAGRHGRAVRSLALAVPADRLRRWRFTEGRPSLHSPRTGCSCWPVRPTPARARSFTASRRSRRTGTITRRGRRSSSRARAGSPVRW